MEYVQKKKYDNIRMPVAMPSPSKTSTKLPNGFSPELWGPSMWFMFHLIAAMYPDNPTTADKANHAAFYRSLQHVLPCIGCRMGYATIITSEPTKMTARVFASRQSLFKWTVDVHNRVNAKLNKPIHNDWKAWYREYNKMRS